MAGGSAPGSFERLLQRKKFGRKSWQAGKKLTKGIECEHRMIPPGCGRGQKCLFAETRVCRTTPAPPELKPNT